MNYFDKNINDLIDQYSELSKEYISYLEVDMNEDAKKVNNKMNKIIEKINALRKQQYYVLKQDSKRTIDLYKKFIISKGLTYEFENFVENEQEEK